MAEELLHLLSDIVSKWVLIMSGVGGIAISIWERRKGPVGWRTFLHISIWVVVVAALYAWHREYQEKLSLLNSDVVISRGPSSFVYEHEGSRNGEPGIYIIVSDLGLTNRNVNPVVLAPTIRLLGRIGEAPLAESSEDDPLPHGVEEWLRSRSLGIGTHRLSVLINIDGRKSESGYTVFFIRKAAFLMWPEFQTKYLGQIGRVWLVFVDQLTGKTYPQALFGTAIKVPEPPPEFPKQTTDKMKATPPSVGCLYVNHRIEIHNLGKKELELWGDKLGEGRISMERQPTMIPVEPFNYHINADAFEKEVLSQFGPNGETRVPFYVFVSDNSERRWTITCELWAVIKNNQLTVETRTVGRKLGWMK